MTGPKDPDDWGFPEVDPASTELPAPSEPAYDTGSDAWWRAQAEAQRKAAATEPVLPPEPPAPPAPLPPPELVEPEVLNAPSPLDEAWVPPELQAGDEAQQTEAEPEPPTEQLPAADLAEPVADVYPQEPSERVARQPYEGQRVGPARALAGAGLALLGVLLAIGALLVFNGNDEPKGGPAVAMSPTATTTPSPTASASPEPSAPTEPATSAPPVATSRPPVAAPIVPVTVLNNTRRTGFARTAANHFRAGGWPVPTTGNYRGRLTQTTVYFAPGQEASARRFAAQFHVPRVLPRSALPGLPSSGMTVVLTRDYTF